MSFSNKIANYTNSTSSENVADALKKGLDYTIGQVSNLNPDMLRLFAYKVDLNTHTGSDVTWESTYNLSYLIDVKRGDKFCRPITDRQSNDAVDSSSIYYALSNDPVYWLDSEGSLSVKPATSTTNKLNLFGVPASNGRTINDSAETVTITSWGPLNGVSYIGAADKHFPNIFKELIVLHASECILMERLADFRVSIPTGLDAEWADALVKAKKLFDDGAGIQGDNAGASMSVQYWLSDEDEDMAGTTMQAISTELGRADRYQTKFKADLERLATDYQWTQGQIQMINAKKQEFIAVNIKIGPQGSPEKESKV